MIDDIQYPDHYTLENVRQFFDTEADAIKFLDKLKAEYRENVMRPQEQYT